MQPAGLSARVNKFEHYAMALWLSFSGELSYICDKAKAEEKHVVATPVTALAPAMNYSAFRMNLIGIPINITHYLRVL